MFDYEIQRYEVHWFLKGGCSWSCASFDSEDEAVKFIKDGVNRWKNFKLIRIENAILDFAIGG